MKRKFSSSQLGSDVLGVLAEKRPQSFAFGDVSDALDLSTVVAGLLEVNLQVVLQVLLILHVDDVIQEDGPGRGATKRLQRRTDQVLLVDLLPVQGRRNHRQTDRSRSHET